MVKPSDFLITGGGRLDPSWYPGYVLDDLLTSWIDRAGPGSDAVITARVYRMAFTTAADLFMAEPANQRDRDKSSAYLPEQVRWWRAQADRYQDEEDALLGRLGPVITPWEGDETCRRREP